MPDTTPDPNANRILFDGRTITTGFRNSLTCLSTADVIRHDEHLADIVDPAPFQHLRKRFAQWKQRNTHHRVGRHRHPGIQPS